MRIRGFIRISRRNTVAHTNAIALAQLLLAIRGNMCVPCSLSLCVTLTVTIPRNLKVAPYRPPTPTLRLYPTPTPKLMLPSRMMVAVLLL